MISGGGLGGTIFGGGGGGGKLSKSNSLEVDPMLSDDSETFSMRGFIVGEDELPEVD